MATLSVNYADFEKVFQVLVTDVLKDPGVNKYHPEVTTGLEEVLRYTVTQNVKTYGYLVSQVYGQVCGPNVTIDQINLSYVLGWCWQMFRTFLTLLEEYSVDEMPWHEKQISFPGNHDNAIVGNDATLLEQATYVLLRKYFGDLPIFPEIQEYFSSVAYEYILGKIMDQQQSVDIETTMTKYLACARSTNFKYRFAGPPQLAMVLAGYPMECELWKKIDNLCDDLMLFWVVKHDMDDSFGEQERKPIGQMDGDIKSGKCTWLIVKAKEICSLAQCHSIKVYYGRSDLVSVAAIKGIYRKLGIIKLGEEYLEMMRENLKHDTDNITKEQKSLGEIFQQMVNFYEI